MSSATVPVQLEGEAPTGSAVVERLRSDPAYQAFMLLRTAFTAAPILFGADKFANVMVDWEKYLAPWIREVSPLGATHTMYAVGVIEVIAGVLVALKPRYAAYVVAAWLGGIIVDLLSYPGFYDIALRDLGLMLGALALARLASRYDTPGLRPTLGA